MSGPANGNGQAVSSHESLRQFALERLQTAGVRVEEVNVRPEVKAVGGGRHVLTGCQIMTIVLAPRVGS